MRFFVLFIFLCMLMSRVASNLAKLGGDLVAVCF